MKRLLRRVRRLFFRDFWRKLIAVFFALLIYFTIRDRISNDEMVFEHIPVQIEYPDDLVNLSELPATVRVVLTGNSRSLRALSPLDIICRARIMRSRYVNGQPYELQLQENNFKISKSFVELKRFSPDRLMLMLEPVVNKSVKIKLNFDTRGFSPDYGFEGTVFTSDVKVRGPQSLIGPLTEVESTLIPLAGATAPFKFEAGLRGPQNVIVLPAKTLVQVNVAIRTATRQIDSIPVLLQLPVGATFEYDIPRTMAMLELRGPAESLKNLTTSDVRVILSLDKYAKEGDYKIKLQAEVNDPAISVTKIIPESVEVRIKNK